MDRRPLVVVTGRNRPHQVLFLAWSVLSGATYLLGAPAPGSVNALMPAWEVHAWAAGLAASGVAGLVGTWWRDRGTGLLLEQGAMLLGAGALLMYVVAVLAIGGLRGAFAAGLAGTWMAANLWRAGQIRRDLHELKGAT